MISFLENVFKKRELKNKVWVSPLSTFTTISVNAKMVKLILEKVTKKLDIHDILYRIVYNEDIEIMKCLNPYMTTTQREKAITTATSLGKVKFLELFILPNPKLYCDYISKNYLLHMAVKSGYVEIVKFFLCHTQVLATAKDYSCNRPMFYAIKNNDIETVKIIANHLNEDELSKDLKSFHLAAKHGYHKILKILCQKSGKIS